MPLGDFIVKTAARFPNHVVVVDQEKRLTAKELLEGAIDWPTHSWV